MSPEQATGDRGLDARSDLYSLAAMLYEMLAGEPPITGATVQAVIAKLMTERPTRLRAIRRHGARGDRRGGGEGAGEGARGSAGRVWARSCASSRRRRPRWPARDACRGKWLVATVLIVTTATAVWKARDSLRPVVRRAYSSVRLTSTGRARSPIISPDGTQIAYKTERCTDDGSCRERILVRETSTDAERTFIESGDEALPLRWSPDGSRLMMIAWGWGGPSGLLASSRLGGSPAFLGNGVGDFVRGGDTALATPGLLLRRGSSIYLRRFVLPLSQPMDSILLAKPGQATMLGWLAISPTGRWIAAAWLDRGQVTIGLHARSGSLLDSLTPPASDDDIPLVARLAVPVDLLHVSERRWCSPPCRS